MRALRCIWAVLIVLFFWLSEAGARQPDPSRSNLRTRTIAISADSVFLDTLSILPKTFQVEGIAADDYRLDFVRAILYWNKKPARDSVKITYRVFGYRLHQSAQRMRYDSIMNNMSLQPYEFNNELTDAQRGIFNFGTIKAEGSFGRQITFGNSQDAVLNSTLNLQLSGMLGDSIEILAAITDNNIPIQPDGTTQQLNEFDQVFLQFKKKNWQLNLGDIDIRQNQSYFLNFYKRLQGVSFQTKNNIGKNVGSNTLVSGSVAKGKFTRNVFQGLEGNQGPYRLTGASSETFFIVLANTERVFLDGELMQRGEDQDYIINYNTAEIAFTPKRMITKDSRIQVEFEYADRNFLNANFYLSQEFDFSKKLKLRVGAFTNTDAKNSQINQVLDGQQKQFLAGVGDSVQQAFYPSAIVDTFAAGKILYEKQYYDNGGAIDSFYRYTTEDTSTLYNLSFAHAGAGNGNYEPDFNGANGKVYRFIAPVSGVKQGSYEPVLLLVTPKKQQLINLGVDYEISKTTLLKAEVAMSDYDINTFSKVNNGDDKGFASRIQLQDKRILKESSKLELQTGIDYEFVQQKFRPLERLRTVEFSRDWGLVLQARPATENILRLSAGLNSNRKQSINYRFTNYHRSDNYKGFQNMLVHRADWKGWELNNELVLTNFNTLSDKGSFFRPTIDIGKQLKKLDDWKLGFRYMQEHNEVRNKATDTISPLAFSFDTYSAYLKSNQTKKNRYGITFFTRADRYAYGHSLIKGDRSINVNVQTELEGNDKRKFYLNATFRKLKILNPLLSVQDADETILGRAQYVMNEWKGLLTGDILYEVGAGQEQRRDLAYFEVPAGTGQYAWIDYNNDGIQQLNEFELAAFPDQARFIRIFTPTNEFIKANYTTFNYKFELNPRVLLNKPDLKGFKKLVSRLNFITSLQISNKTSSSGSFQFNPFKYSATDTALITLSTVLVNTLSFNRFSSVWGIDVGNMRRNGKSLLTYGYENMGVTDWTAKFRWNFSRSLSFTWYNRSGKNYLLTPNTNFENRNYELSLLTTEPMLSYIKGTSFRIMTSYKFENRKNKPEYGGEKSLSHSVSVESKYNVLQNSSLTGKFTFNNLDYRSANPSVATTVSYIMLDGLQPGKNLLWALTLTKRLLNNLELNFQYDGRKPAGTRTVHIGRATLTALF